MQFVLGKDSLRGLAHQVLSTDIDRTGGIFTNEIDRCTMRVNHNKNAETLDASGPCNLLIAFFRLRADRLCRGHFGTLASPDKPAVPRWFRALDPERYTVNPWLQIDCINDPEVFSSDGGSKTIALGSRGSNVPGFRSLLGSS